MDAREQVMAGLVPWTCYERTHRLLTTKSDCPIRQHWSEDGGKMTICGRGFYGSDHWRQKAETGLECTACQWVIQFKIKHIENAVDVPTVLTRETGLIVTLEGRRYVGRRNGIVLIRARGVEQFRAAASALLPMLPKGA